MTHDEELKMEHFFEVDGRRGRRGMEKYYFMHIYHWRT
jgi:hypothetical protein